MIHTLTRLSMSRRRSFRIGATAALVLVAACASAPNVDPTDQMSARPAAASDSLATAELNRRIEAAAARNSMLRANEPGEAVEYRIGKGDQIEVSVFGADAFDGTYRVEESGDIAMPLLGAVNVAGKSAREVEVHLVTSLAETYMKDPHVTVQIVEMRSHGVSVVGSVGRPGVYQLPGPTSLLEVLAMAGGLTPAAGNKVFIQRPGLAGMEEADDPDAGIIEVDLGALVESGRRSENVSVRSGDIVQVRQAGLVYVVGQVNRPGGFMVPSGSPMTVLQAVAMAQGLGRTAAASRAMIVREGLDGAREEIPVDLDAVLKGDESAPALVERDVLFIPNSGTKSFSLGVVGALVSMVTLRGLIY